MWPEDGTGGWHHCLSAQLPAEQQLYSWAHTRTDLPNPKAVFPFSPPCTFSSFSSITCSHAPSLVACPCFFASQTVLVIVFFSTLFAATTFLALFLIQHKAYSPFPRSPRKSCPFYLTVIWSPLAVHSPPQKAEGNGILSSPSYPPLSSEGVSKRLVHATKGETSKRRILLALFMSDFSAEWG